MIATHASVRAQIHRAHNKGVTVHLWPSERAQRHPQLEACLREWLSTRGLPPLHFMVEPDTLGSLADRRVFVAERVGVPVGFVVASPVVGRRGWLIEQFVRGAAAPNGTAEVMIDAAITWMAQHEAEYVTLGLAPLSRRAGVAEYPMAWWLRATLAWVRAHGRRFYNFDGLDAFKAKFHPERWEPVFAIANEPRFSFETLYAIAAAFTNGRPLLTVVGGVGKALHQEWRWLIRRHAP
jgi:phosphatidylglycerol lysyltransferase